jgi:ribose 5-phosphate isomerase A
MSDDPKYRAAEAAMAEVRPGMRLGLGTGSTARHFVDLIGRAVAEGLDVLCISAFLSPTSRPPRSLT